MKARLLPLDGKYYGTEIEVSLGNDFNSPLRDIITVWFASGTPSRRELESMNYTEEQWSNNDVVEDGWGNKSPIRSQGLMCDNHYECSESLRAAEAIVEALNKL